VEDDLLTVYPTATTSDCTRGEDAFTVSGLDECVSGGFPIGSFTPREVSLPPVSTSEAQEGQVLVVVGGEADNLLARVGEVKVNPIVVAEDSERPRLLLDWVWLMQGLGVEVSVVDGLKHFGGRGRLGRQWLGNGFASDVSAYHVSRPALGLSVGKVPSLGHVSGRGDDADVWQLLADKLDTLATRLIGVRPEEDATPSKGRPVG
jgi:hypothetical protein